MDEPINEARLGGGETGEGKRVAGSGRNGNTAVFNKLRQRREGIWFRETIETQEGKVAFGENQVADVDRDVVGPLCLEEADRDAKLINRLGDEQAEQHGGVQTDACSTHRLGSASESFSATSPAQASATAARTSSNSWFIPGCM